tara:strand:- start:2047 stop:3312 length:1266 start_codon:yes stop_codon:yes gene_type:complete
MHFWYKLLTYLLYFFIPIYLFFRKLQNKEDSKRYVEKLSKINTPRGEGFLLWYHVASVGEAMSILPLVEKFKENTKIDKILITTITLSSAQVLRKKFKQDSKIIHQFLPFDVPIYIDKFLAHWSPNIAIFVDSEIWPNLIFQIKKKNIPLMLINARITQKTFSRWKIMKNFSKKVFGKFDLCIASNTETESYLKILGAKNIKNFGNLKFAKSKINLQNKMDTLFLEKIKNRKIWCAASTHFSEERFCAETHIKIKKIYNNILTIIIPRHITRIKKINDELAGLNLKINLYSNYREMDTNTDILLVDTYGEASKFYEIAKCVFLGKSLIKSLEDNSGQNPIEASRLACKIFHGPYVRNFTEIYTYLKSMNVTNEIRTSEELCLSLVEELKGKKVKNQEILNKIENYGQNTLNNVVEELKNYI